MNINSSNDRMKKANEIHEICKRKFQTSLLALHYEINSYGSQSQTMETNAIECNNNGISASLSLVFIRLTFALLIYIALNIHCTNRFDAGTK